MKVVPSKEMARIESLAYQADFKEESFMEQAGLGVAKQIKAFIEKNYLEKNIFLLCGKGNNSGDAYVAGRYLLDWGFSVQALQLTPFEACSPLCQKNAKKFTGSIIHLNDKQITQNSGANYDNSKCYHSNSLSFSFPKNHTLVDALFGTGFRGEVKDPFKSIIQSANSSDLPIISIDIPSGLNGSTGQVESSAIKATFTIFLGLPKTGFFLQNGWNYTGHIKQVDFCLKKQFIEQGKDDFLLLTKEKISQYIPKVTNSRHKYEAGYVAGFAGSKGMPGAAILAGKATLKNGAGIVRIFHPKGMEAEFSGAPYEIIRKGYDLEDLKQLLTSPEFTKAKSFFVGPGIACNKKSTELLKFLLPLLDKLNKPTVIDADALTLAAQEKIPLPKQAILTPHIGEVLRLLSVDSTFSNSFTSASTSNTPASASVSSLNSKTYPIDLPFLKLCQQYAQKNKIILVLKGGPSFIFTEDEPFFVCPIGSPGMATAGSGDVLTGMIAALLAQRVPPKQAACLGVYLHGLAGKYAEERLTPYCMVASDIIHFLPQAWKNLVKNYSILP